MEEILFQHLNQDHLSKLCADNINHNDVKFNIVMINEESPNEENVDKLKCLSTTKQCIARINGGDRCSRRNKDGTQFCGGHLKAIPYGRFDCPEQKCVKMKGNSIKSKNISQNKDLDVDLSQYIKTTVIVLNNTPYLIDKHGIIYENDNGHTIVGKKGDGDDVSWF
jgi:hypothetical protein